MVNLLDINYQPELQEISEFIENSLFDELCKTLIDEYQAKVRIEFSKDVWARGWNIKFRKSGRSLCVLYPKKKYFTMLIVIGRREKEMFDHLYDQLSDEMRNIYLSTKGGMDQRWLMIDITSENEVYRDALRLIEIR